MGVGFCGVLASLTPPALPRPTGVNLGFDDTQTTAQFLSSGFGFVRSGRRPCRLTRPPHFSAISLLLGIRGYFIPSYLTVGDYSPFSRMASMAVTSSRTWPTDTSISCFSLPLRSTSMTALNATAPIDHRDAEVHPVNPVFAFEIGGAG